MSGLDLDQSRWPPQSPGRWTNGLHGRIALVCIRRSLHYTFILMKQLFTKSANALLATLLCYSVPSPGPPYKNPLSSYETTLCQLREGDKGRVCLSQPKSIIPVRQVYSEFTLKLSIQSNTPRTCFGSSAPSDIPCPDTSGPSATCTKVLDAGNLMEALSDSVMKVLELLEKGKRKS